MYGKDQAEHDIALRAVLQRLQDCNLTLNKEKCEYNKKSINFYGYTFSSNGTAAKEVESINNAPNPRSATELRSLLGLVNYVSRFIPNYASITAPLRKLTRKNARYLWKSKHQRALDEIKSRLVGNDGLL